MFMDTKGENPDNLEGFWAKLCSLEPLIEKLTKQQPAGMTLNFNFYEGASIGQQIERTDTSNMWMGASGEVRTNSLETTDNTQKQPTMEQLKQAITECEYLLWGKSSYAVCFCVCRDCYGYEGGMSAFERQLQQMGFDCPDGTLARAFSNNPYFKHPYTRWKELRGNKRAVSMAEKFVEVLDGLMEKKSLKVS